MDIPSSRRADIGLDQLLAFAIPDRDCRGRIIRLGPVLDTVLSAHDYPPAIRALLAEALTLASLMGGLLKEAGDQLTLQAQPREGIVSLLVCDYRDGELRGYVQHDRERLAEAGAQPPLGALFGEGSLTVTFDLAKGERYQGIVPLEGGSMSEAVEAYFARSEQIPTLIRTAVRSGEGGYTAGGILVQHLADGEEGRERLHARIDHPEWGEVAEATSVVSHRELVDPSLDLEALIGRLYLAEREIRLDTVASVRRGCRCSEYHFEQVLSRFPSEDRRDMRNEAGMIVVDCAFCSREFSIQD